MKILEILICCSVFEQQMRKRAKSFLIMYSSPSDCFRQGKTTGLLGRVYSLFKKIQGLTYCITLLSTYKKTERLFQM
jgi:hypothetical protein